MTDTDIATAVPATYERSAQTTVEVVDEDKGRMLGRIVPFGETARIREVVDGDLVDFDEEFLPGCTARIRHNVATFGAHFLRLQLGHDEPGVDKHLGYGVSLEERGDGAYGEFQLYTKRRDYGLVREMLGTAWKGLSVSFRDRVPPVVDRSGERMRVGRVQVEIEHIAAVPLPAYASAGVLSIRGDESMIPDAGTPALDAAVALLAELRAQIAENDSARLQRPHSGL